MAIHELTDDEAVQRCERCGSEHRIPLSSLQVGAGQGGYVDGEVVRLPRCSTCGATEFLVRSPDGEAHPSPGTFGHLHRLLVDHLHTRLVEHAQVDPELVRGGRAPGVGARTSEADRALWFPRGMKIESPERKPR
ncbi:MAG: hypothetical protein ACTHU0_20400 [Kofleriaceae bacterium]